MNRKFLRERGITRRELTKAGFKDIHIQAVVKLSRWHTAEHFVRSMVAGAPTMLGDLAGQGPAVLDSMVAEIAEALRWLRLVSTCGAAGGRLSRQKATVLALQEGTCGETP